MNGNLQFKYLFERIKRINCSILCSISGIFFLGVAVAATPFSTRTNLSLPIQSWNVQFYAIHCSPWRVICNGNCDCTENCAIDVHVSKWAIGNEWCARFTKSAVRIDHLNAKSSENSVKILKTHSCAYLHDKTIAIESEKWRKKTMQIVIALCRWKTKHEKVNQNACLNRVVMQSTWFARFAYQTNSIQPLLIPFIDF